MFRSKSCINSYVVSSSINFYHRVVYVAVTYNSLDIVSWTDQQRDAAAKEGWGYRLTFSARLVGLVLVADALFIGAQKVGQYLQELRYH
ncbi:Rhodanese-like domain-containing protein 11, chloroplastic [Datura stramonium]|uniref:Rhodanese-like domain-containing protein 11, chloroplastic n=1 Tax=Datura stramonium TaxID=4076 RepID=A0ABS8V8G9_DATST|nr:Rhodanese-like domain-containing protein 11, chloroplastic [Datura stramonium]